MNLEIREDSTYTFTFQRVVDGLTKGLTSATLAIVGSDGEEYQTATAMTVSSNVATKAINFATDPTSLTYSRGRNYKAVITATYSDSTVEVIPRLFDIVLYPFVNQVSDQDLISENRMLENGIQEEGGEASSGSTTTLVDLNRSEANDWWNGGKLFVMPLLDDGKITEHTVTDFVSSTGTITFTPARTAVTTEAYTIRRSYQQQITTAGEIVQADIASNGKQAYLMIDSTQVNRLIIYKCLERWFQQARKAEGDQYDLQFNYYRGEYDKLFNSIPLMYDADDSGSIEEDEQQVGTFTIVEISR